MGGGEIISSFTTGFCGLWTKPRSPSVQFVLPVWVWAEGRAWLHAGFARINEFAPLLPDATTGESETRWGRCCLQELGCAGPGCGAVLATPLCSRGAPPKAARSTGTSQMPASPQLQPLSQGPRMGEAAISPPLPMPGARSASQAAGSQNAF